MERETTSRGASSFRGWYRSMKASPAVEQHRAFAAQRFREQKPRRAFHVERGGMELDEFDIGDLGAGALGHGHAVAGGHVGIGGFEKTLPESAGGQQHGARVDGAHSAICHPTGRRPQHARPPAAGPTVAA